MPNRLARETSPYLLQHQRNPVNWNPWDAAALEQARREAKPIFLSIGYSACHWCHVMEHESFESPEIAAYLNERFVSIKVDREERPDLDQIYMNAVQMMTGRGGWPMSVFLTPSLKPFYAGTYFPPTARGGMPGFLEVLRAVHDAWSNRRENVEQVSNELTADLQRVDNARPGALSEDLVRGAIASLQRSFDARWGGFGQAPKFPHASDLALLLRHWYRTGAAESLAIVETSLARMAAGGIYDHLGGGFARYSVDAQWLVPHFEKMLYDNALLGRVYVEASQATGNVAYERIARETLDYVLRDMTDPSGGFYSAEDADSEGEEGKFYVWSLDEVRRVLGDDAAATFAAVYDVTAQGNFEGRTILHLPRPIAEAAVRLQRDLPPLEREMAVCRAKLFEVRRQRVHPSKDDKVLVAWNGLMIETLAAAGAALGETRYIAAAEKAADFLLREVRADDGRLLHTWRQGTAKLAAYLDDYAALACGLTALYEATFDRRRIDQAAHLVDLVESHFSAPDGGYYFTPDDHETLIARQRDFTDNASPGGNGLMVVALLKLGKLTGKGNYLAAAEKTLTQSAGLMRQAPMAMGQMLAALDFWIGPAYELALAPSADTEGQALREHFARRYLPRSVRALADEAAGAPGAAPSPLESLLAGKTPIDGQSALYVCEGSVCQSPVVGDASIRARLGEVGRAPLGSGGSGTTSAP